MFKFVAILMFMSSVCFANGNDDIRCYQAQAAAISASMHKSTIDTLRTNAQQNKSEHHAIIDDFLRQAKLTTPVKQQPKSLSGAVLFVSFSMPESLLFALADEAAAFDIPLVINGLVDGDFKKTIDTFSRLHRKAEEKHLNYKGLSIDPIWFEHFQIKSVPALVVSARPSQCEPQTICAAQTFDVVYGNPHVKKALELIASKGESASKLAQEILGPSHV